jgi:hypothetical protein
MPVPDGLQEGVRKTEVEDVLHRLLAQIVVDPEDGLLGKGPVKRGVEGAGRSQVAAERLLQDHARAQGTAGLGELLHHRGEHAGRDGEIVGRALRGAELGAQPAERRHVIVVAVHVAQPLHEPREGLRVGAAAVLPELASARATNCSRLQPDLATPMTGKSRRPRRAMAWSAGKIFL